jgi:nucleotide-binding universal stress UspA family protein
MSNVLSNLHVGAKLNSILFATDLSIESRKPLRHAISIARHYGSTLFVVYVVSSLGYAMAGREAEALAVKAAERDMAEFQYDLHHLGILNGLDCYFVVLEGDIREELESIVWAKHIDLVVVGTSGRHGLDKFFLGSVAEQVFRHFTCPVLTVGPHSVEDWQHGQAENHKPFLFITSFHEASRKALQYAVSLANRFEEQLVMLHVLPKKHYDASSDATKSREQAELLVIDHLKRLLPADVALAKSPVFIAASDRTAEGVLNAASRLHAQAIIMGARHAADNFIATHYPWSTAHQVIRGAECPVLTVRG